MKSASASGLPLPGETLNPFQLNPAFAILVLATGLFVAAAAVFDLRSRRIPNALNFTMLGLAVVFQVTVSIFGGWHHLLSGLLGMGIGFTVMFVLWIVGGGGGGDVKLMAALGMWLGARMILVVFIVSTLIVAAMLVGSWVVRFGRWASQGFPQRPPEDTGPPRHSIAFATPVALATWLLLGWCVVLQSTRGATQDRPVTFKASGVFNAIGSDQRRSACLAASPVDDEFRKQWKSVRKERRDS